MNTHVAYCPTCHWKTPTEPDAATRGVQCGRCGNAFVPDEVFPIDGDPNLRSISSSGRVKKQARSLSVVSGFGFAICLFWLAAAAATAVSGDNWPLYLVFAGCSFVCGVLAALFAQLLHIRAALEHR